MAAEHITSVNLSGMLRNSSGGLEIAVPETNCVLHIVTQYKHLGSITAIDGSNMPYVKARAASATSSYVPLAARLFGSSLLYLSLKLNYMGSLILSKLLFNSHVQVLSAREVAVLNAVYMRVLRRIADAVRAGPGCGTDRAVREKLGYPSIDCVLQRRRLLYAGRLLRAGHKHLIALLSVRDSIGEPALPWTQQFRKDLCAVNDGVAEFRAVLPEPKIPRPWFDFMLQQPLLWEEFVALLNYSHSVCDKSAQSEPSKDTTPNAVPCELCPAPHPAFKSHKALAQHQRTTHGVKSAARFYANANGTCASCGTRFHTRLRLMAYLTDKRRTKCLVWLQDNVPALSNQRVKDFDEDDRLARKEARRSGHTHAIAKEPAMTIQDKRIGHVK